MYLLLHNKPSQCLVASNNFFLNALWFWVRNLEETFRQSYTLFHDTWASPRMTWTAKGDSNGWGWNSWDGGVWGGWGVGIHLQDGFFTHMIVTWLRKLKDRIRQDCQPQCQQVSLPAWLWPGFWTPGMNVPVTKVKSTETLMICAPVSHSMWPHYIYWSGHSQLRLRGVNLGPAT